MSKLTISLCLVALATTTVAAEPVKLQLHGGAGAAVVDVEECPGGNGLPCDLETVRHSVSGAGPLLAIGVLKQVTSQSQLKVRLGADLASSFVADGNGVGGTLGLLGKFGLGLGPVYGDLGVGFSAMHLNTDDLDRTQGSMVIHFGAGVELTEKLTLAARADAHVMMHSEMAAAFIGGGLTWTP